MNSNSTIQVRFGDWISEGWKMFTEQWKGWVTIALGFFVVVILPIGAFVVGWYALFITSVMAQQPSRGRPPEMPAAAFLLLYHLKCRQRHFCCCTLECLPSSSCCCHSRFS